MGPILTKIKAGIDRLTINCKVARESAVLDRVVETILAIVGAVPAWLTSEGSPTFMLVRAMFGLLLIVLIVYLIAMRPLRFAIARWMERASRLFSRKR